MSIKSLISLTIRRQAILREAKASTELKLNLGCGRNRQDGYLNVDIRALPNIDLVASPQQCARLFPDHCDEVYISHVLEHQGHPGKAMRENEESVLGFLGQMHKLLKPGGRLRVAVPDFGALARLYVQGEFPLYPRLVGRLCGEQDYPENLHKCLFDKAFLTFCLEHSGFSNIHEWDPAELGLNRDSSYDELNGVSTSLNLIAQKI